MKQKLLGLIFVIFGLLIMVAAVMVEIAWLGFCFGTVIVGILMLLLAPGLLFGPLIVIFGTGAALWGSGLLMIKSD